MPIAVPPVPPQRASDQRMTAAELASLRLQIQQRLFQAEDHVSFERAELVTEAWRQHHADPPVIRRARALDHVLANATVTFDPNPVFAGTTSETPRAWTLFPEYGIGVDVQVIDEHEGCEHLCSGALTPCEQAFWAEQAMTPAAGGNAGPGHLVVDYGRVVDAGLAAIAEDVAAGSAGDPVYRTAMGITLNAVRHWAERQRDRAISAAAMAAHHGDHARANALHAVATACDRVPWQPATTLHEALQAVILVHLALVLEGHGTSLSIGRLDRILHRFGDAIAADPDAAAEMIGCFLLAITANGYQGRASKTQAITVGGPGSDPRISLAILRAFDRTPVADPHVFLRWHDGLDRQVREQAVAMLAAGRSMPMLIGDAQVIPGLTRCGLSPTDASNYAIIGCNEIGVPGVSWSLASAVGTDHNDLALLMQALAQQPTLDSVSAIIAAWGEALEAQLVSGMQQQWAWRQCRQQQRPMPLTSALFRSGPALACDYLAQPDNATIGAFTRGTANLVNALAAIDHVAFGTDGCGLPALLEALNQHDEAVLDRCRAAPKWGNDDARADDWLPLIDGERRGVLDRLAAAAEIPALAVCHVVRSQHHLDGRDLGATPDGRRAGDPLGDSLGAVIGTASEGPTAILNSVLKADPLAYRGGSNCNLSLVSSQAQPPILDALISGFFADGGQELQVAVLDPSTLRAAQTNPERFADLVVRIAGFNARFVELSRLEQDEVIRRAECACA